MNVGIGYFLTTSIFDIDQYERFINQVGTFNVPVIEEVMILRTSRHGKIFESSF